MTIFMVPIQEARLSEQGHCSRFNMVFELVLHDGADGDVDAEGVVAADDFEVAAGGEFFD